MSEFSQGAKWSHKFKTWQQHFMNMTKRRRFMAMFWCKRAGKTYTAAHLVIDRMLKTPYYSVCVYNDYEFISIITQIIQRDDILSRVSAFTDSMIIMDNGSYVFMSIGIVKADLLYINDFNNLPEGVVDQIIQMTQLEVINDLLISTGGGNSNLNNLRKALLKFSTSDLYIDFVDWRYIIDDIKEFWTSDEDWKADLINEIGKEQFDKDYETNIE